MAVFVDPPVDVTPGATGSFVDIDVSTSVPAGATGVILHITADAGGARDIGLRKNGSTDSRIRSIVDTSHSWAMVGVDSSPAMIDLARRSYGNAAANVDFRLGDAQALDFGARFDLAFSNAALHWARDQPAVLRGVAAALVPGCRIFFSMGGRGTAAVVSPAATAGRTTRS